MANCRATVETLFRLDLAVVRLDTNGEPKAIEVDMSMAAKETPTKAAVEVLPQAPPMIIMSTPGTSIEETIAQMDT